MKLHKSIIRLLIPAMLLCAVSIPNCVDVPRNNPADRGGDDYDGIYSDNRITEFRFGDLQVNGVISHEENTIVVPVLYGSDVTALAPEFTTNAESVIISGREQRSGITVNDYSGSVVYEVTARDGSYREYTVSIQEVVFTSFFLSDPALPYENEANGTIDYENSTITVLIPYYMDITNLVLSFEAAGNVFFNDGLNDEQQESGVTARDFTDAAESSFVYKVEAENGEMQAYSVTVAYKEPAAGHFAGSLGGLGAGDGTGSDASFRHPLGVTSDYNNLYVADYGNHTIRKIEISTGIVTTIAGTAGQAGSDNGTGSAARFRFPAGITTDGINLYVADRDNHTIRKIVISTGVVTTIAGDAGADPDNIDGNGSDARFSGPYGVTMDGINLYVTDLYNSNIRQIELSSGNYAVSTFATGFNGPKGITTDGENLYVADSTIGIISRIVISTKAVSTFASGFNNPNGITTDRTNLYVADEDNNMIRRIVIDGGAVSTIAGSGSQGFTDGMGGGAAFFAPAGVTIRNGILYVTDGSNANPGVCDNSIIRKISQDRQVITFAGYVNESGFVNDTGTAARFDDPYDVATDGTNLYICDSANLAIRQIVISSGVVSTFADGLGEPKGITTDGTYLYVCDSTNSRILKFEISSGASSASTVATGLSNPVAIATDGADLYVCDNSNTIRRINISSPDLTTFKTIDGSNLTGITTDGTNLYVCDYENHVIRQIVISTGVVSTIAGEAGTAGYADDPDGYTGGLASRFRNPYGITTDGASLYISESGDPYAWSAYNQTIRKIVISTGIVSTLAGTSGLAGNTDGASSIALFSFPLGLEFCETNKNLYICDWVNNAIRVIIP